MTDSTLSLDLGPDRSVAWYAGDSVRYLVATVQAHRASESETPVPTNIAVVIDTSASMSGEKLARARQAVSDVIRALGERDRLSVVTFSSDARVHVRCARMDEPGRRAALDAVAALETQSQTNLSEGWFTGAACVAEGMGTEEAIHRVIVLSDGMANEGITSPAELAEHAGQLQARGIVTSTVGIGNDYQAPVLQSLAEHGGGQMHDAEHAEDMESVLLGELSDTRLSAVHEAILAFEIPAGVEASMLGFYPATREHGRLLVRLGSLGSGLERHVPVKITLPAGGPGEAISFRVTAVGTAPGSDAAVAATPAETTITLARGEQNNAQPRDIGRSLLVAEAWHASVLRDIARMHRDGERRQAKHYLERELHFFERYCRRLPGTEHLVRELTRTLHHIDRAWSERTRKDMEYAAFRQVRGQRDHRGSPGRGWAERMESE